MLLIFTWPVRSWSLGVGLTADVAPQPVIRSTSPTLGVRVDSANGVTSVTGLASSPRAMSVLGDCCTHTTDTSCPPVPDTIVRPMVAIVGYGTGPLTRLRSTSWKQCPAVMIHRAETSAAGQALSRGGPSRVGRVVM